MNVAIFDCLKIVMKIQAHCLLEYINLPFIPLFIDSFSSAFPLWGSMGAAVCHRLRAFHWTGRNLYPD